jgi:hypothetical protein
LPGILLTEEGLLFRARNTSALEGFTLPGRENLRLRMVYSFWPGILLPREGSSPIRKNPGNPEIQEVFKARKSLIGDISGFPAGDADNFLTVYSLENRQDHMSKI